MKQFLVSYQKRLIETIAQIDIEAVVALIETLDRTGREGKRIFIIGNGGSAATASHMANDLSIGLKLRNIRHFDIESLADNGSICTAIANDVGYENIFYAQLKNRIGAGDLLIAISCSGNSPNILKAAELAKREDAILAAVTGFDGGALKEMADLSFHVPSDRGEYGIVEDVHMILDHMIYSYYISLKPETKTTYTME